MKRISILLLLQGWVFSLGGDVSLAKPAIFTLEELVKSSDVIVVAKVEKIVALKSGVRVADARVLEMWKGGQADRLRFRASPRWLEDVSGAEVGETTILFLSQERNSSIMSIAIGGRGRLPIKEFGGDPDVALRGIILSKGTRRRVGIPENAAAPSMKLSTLKSEIEVMEAGRKRGGVRQAA